MCVAAASVSAGPVTWPSGGKGRICVLDMVRDMTKGFISSIPIAAGDNQGLYTITNVEDEALWVKFNGNDGATLEAMNNEDKRYPYLAFIAGPGDANTGDLLDDGAYSFVYLGGSSQITPGNSPPQKTQNSPRNHKSEWGGENKVAETGTWRITYPDHEGLGTHVELAPYWTNLNGQRSLKQTVFYDEYNPFFGITNDWEEHRKLEKHAVEVVRHAQPKYLLW
ncbi:hypothetical protein FRB98_006391 [Tulasnella sp. 332]|nr:hypothetical protein FRB98_006391 [Tulasnella sp. 332]